MPKSANVSTRRATSVLLCAFFVTGATSLIFEVVWVRLLLLALGTTPVAMGVVLSAFMGGMAVGSWLAGRAVVRRLSPIAVYAGLEAWIGVWALATPLVLRLVDLAPPAGQLALGVLALLPATVAMGTSLPVLVRALDGSSTVRATTVGWLYAANTAGGVAGPLLAVFLLFPLAGLSLTLVVAAVVNLALSVAVWLGRSLWSHAGVCSMSRTGDCWDNAVTESFFATLKTELIHRQPWPTRRAATDAVADYIEGFYNPYRLHSSLGYLSPNAFERRHVRNVTCAA